jgi:hypothetical protein
VSAAATRYRAGQVYIPNDRSAILKIMERRAVPMPKAKANIFGLEGAMNLAIA